MSHPVLTPLRTPGRAPRVLTIDVEDWFHVCGDEYFSDERRWESFPARIGENLRRILDLLDRGGHRATFFFLGWIAARHPDLVRETAERGHEIGIHGDRHRRVYEMTPAEFREDLARARDAVERAGRVRTTTHRAAEWSIRHPGEPAVEILAGEGFVCDASMIRVPPLGSASNPAGPYRIASDGASLIEVPPLTGPGFGRTVPVGGGWAFRMFSGTRVRRVEDAFRDSGWPAVFTFHPWEFDPDHPPMEGLSALVHLVHFYNLGGVAGRFRRWLETDRCVTLADVLPRLSAS